MAHNEQPGTRAQPAPPRRPVEKPGAIHLQELGAGCPTKARIIRKQPHLIIRISPGGARIFDQGRDENKRNLLRSRFRQQLGARARYQLKASSTSRDSRNPSAGQFWIGLLPASKSKLRVCPRAAKLLRSPCATFSTPTTIPVDHRHERSSMPQQHSQCRRRTALDAASAGRSSIDDHPRPLGRANRASPALRSRRRAAHHTIN